MGSCHGKHSLLSTECICIFAASVFAVQVVFSFFQLFVFDLDYYGLRCIVGSGTFGNYLFLGVILIAWNWSAVGCVSNFKIQGKDMGKMENFCGFVSWQKHVTLFFETFGWTPELVPQSG